MVTQRLSLYGDCGAVLLQMSQDGVTGLGQLGDPAKALDESMEQFGGGFRSQQPKTIGLQKPESLRHEGPSACRIHVNKRELQRP
jgi:hypothetical protein